MTCPYDGDAAPHQTPATARRRRAMVADATTSVFHGRDAAARQIEYLAGSADKPVRFKLIPNDKAARKRPKEFTGTLAARWQELTEANAEGYNVYVFANEVEPDAGPYATGADITEVRALFADFDGTPLPAKWHIPPTFTLRHDNGRAWAFWKAEGDIPPSDFTGFQQRIAKDYGSDPVVTNRDRVVRLAGFDRWKEGQKCGPYALHEGSGAPVSAAKHDTALPQLP